MDPKIIILLVIIVVLLFFFIRYIMQDVNTLSELTSAVTMQKILAEDLASSESAGNSSNFTYSIWFFIDDWNYRYGKPKVIFGRMTQGRGEKEPCPSVTLGPVQNNIKISLAVYPGLDEQPENGDNFIVHNCSVANVPIQKWCNLLISAYGRTLDIYIDGKLVRTNILPGVAKIDENAPVFITPRGGFSGWTSKFQYWPDSTDPQKAWNIYKQGYGGNALGVGKYSINVTVMEGDTEKSSWTL